MKNDPTKPTMVATRIGLGDVSHSDFRSNILESASKVVSSVPDKLARLAEIFDEFDPMGLLLIVCSYGTSTGVGSKKDQPTGMLQGIEQHHLEVLMTLYARFGIESAATKPATPYAVQEVIDLTKELSSSFLAYRLTAIDFENEDAKQIDSITERIRMHTQAVRNWAYFDHVVDLLEKIYAVDDENFFEHLGFSCADVLLLAQFLLRHAEEVISHRFELLRSVAKGTRAKDIVSRYFKAVDDLIGEPADMLKALGDGASREQALAAVMAHYDLRIPFQLALDVQAISSATGISQARTRAMLATFTLGKIEEDDFDFERTFLANPSWTRPVIEFQDRYICPMPMLFFSHSHRIFRELFERAGLTEQLARRRSKTLEKEAASLFEAAFPDAEVQTGVKWSVGAEQFETDILVSVDHFIFVVEAKSHHFTNPALRGAPSRLKRHVKDILESSSIQSQRLAKIIEKARLGDPASLSVCEQIGLEVGQATQVVRLSITFDDLSYLSGLEQELKAIGWIDGDVELAPYISVSDLRCLFEILESEIFIAHYLFERQEFERFEGMLADEIDLLGIYLQTLFNVEPHEDAQMIFTGMSSEIDRFYLHREVGKTRIPRPKVHPYIKRIISMIETRRKKGWLTFASALLSLGDWQEVAELRKQLDLLKKQVRKHGGDLSKPFCIQVRPPRQHRPLVIFALYRNKHRAKVRDALNDLVCDAFDDYDQNACMVVFVSIENKSPADGFFYAVRANP